MSKAMFVNSELSARNQVILEKIEALGGRYIWEDEIFAVTLLDVEATEDQILTLVELHGVKEIMVKASNLSFACLERIAGIDGLQNLVLSESCLTAVQRSCLRELVGTLHEIPE
jgi:hypothetical protein